jgi:nucleoside 2-deoxyribosyltransferase
MGYMAAQGKPVFGYSNDGRLYGDRVLQPTPERDENNLFVEQFGMHDNLMLEGAIYTSSGDFQGKQIDTANYYTDLSVFEAVIQLAAAKLLS